MSDKCHSNSDNGPDDLRELLRGSANQLRGAAKKCRVKKGGLACDVLDVAAEIVGALAKSRSSGDEPPETTAERETPVLAGGRGAAKAAPSDAAPSAAEEATESGRTEKEDRDAR